MGKEEDTLLKAACLQAAATLMAARRTTIGRETPVRECMNYAMELYFLVKENGWDREKAKA
jgi:hypothetical protein